MPRWPLIISFLVFFTVAGSARGNNMGYSLKSTAFENGNPIPEDYTCDGVGQSPPLDWENTPSGTKSFALIADDPDAPGRTWVHWLLYNIPNDHHVLRPGVSGDKQLPDGSRQGKNDFGKIGYGGPCPPGGTHHYVFHLFALDAAPAIPSGVSRTALESAIQGHVLAEARLTGTYHRR